jgi:hypothetical protein
VECKPCRHANCSESQTWRIHWPGTYR